MYPLAHILGSWVPREAYHWQASHHARSRLHVTALLSGHPGLARVDLVRESSLQQVFQRWRLDFFGAHPERRTILSHPPGVNAPRHPTHDQRLPLLPRSIASMSTSHRLLSRRSPKMNGRLRSNSPGLVALLALLCAFSISITPAEANALEGRLIMGAGSGVTRPGSPGVTRCQNFQ